MLEKSGPVLILSTLIPSRQRLFDSLASEKNLLPGVSGAVQ